jgi:carbonic anhydrase
MQKIIQGVRTFQQTIFRRQREQFERLAQKQQAPMALFITCADSRVNPNLITQTEPGDLFILRNAGNIVPPYETARGGEAATIEYALGVLHINNVIVCGHSQCGAMQNLMNPDLEDRYPSVRAWITHAEVTRRIIEARFGHLPAASLRSLAVEQNVLVQIDNLRTHPAVKEGLARGDLNIFGWSYRIETGDILAYDAHAGQFLPITDQPPEPVPPQVCLAHAF